MEKTCSDIITDWGVGRGVTCLRSAGRKKPCSSSWSFSESVLRIKEPDISEEWVQCSRVWATQEGSPLLKYLQISDPWCYCNNTHLHACFSFTAVHPHTHSHVAFLSPLQHWSFWDAKPHRNLLQTRRVMICLRLRVTELVSCCTCWIYESHSLCVLMLYCGCVVWGPYREWYYIARFTE